MMAESSQAGATESTRRRTGFVRLPATTARVSGYRNNWGTWTAPLC